MLLEVVILLLARRFWRGAGPARRPGPPAAASLA